VEYYKKALGENRTYEAVEIGATGAGCLEGTARVGSSPDGSTKVSEDGMKGIGTISVPFGICRTEGVGVLVWVLE